MTSDSTEVTESQKTLQAHKRHLPSGVTLATGPPPSGKQATASADFMAQSFINYAGRVPSLGFSPPPARQHGT